jgi:hypothetical protein
VLSHWVKHFGWLELGTLFWSEALIRVLDKGGLVWEGGAAEGSLSEALVQAETALTNWFREQDGATQPGSSRRAGAKER